MMPAYFSVDFAFKYERLSPNFVDEIYDAFEKAGCGFKCGFWNAENCSEQEIIVWNQNLLEKKFVLGLDQHFKHDYKQILLKTNVFTHMRLFWMYNIDEIRLTLLVPECEIYDIHNTVFRKDEIQHILKISKKVWETKLPTIIQTCLELDSAIRIKDIRKKKPNIRPFCILVKKHAERFLNKVSKGFIVEEIEDGSVLILDSKKIQSVID